MRDSLTHHPETQKAVLIIENRSMYYNQLSNVYIAHWQHCWIRNSGTRWCNMTCAMPHKST